ncbi:hypothetical protein [Brevibacillus invocatus]|uniref:hypothetical protein n=1 Tax=Brevibacillus invocatus TaxID=173959 RepID=UPI0020420DC3|nr:hypothetical protein [Brevibacillus invocatus]MCM3079093.1 hypothetical protein [Brevibacillus invocatus]MCM3429844.1 hypothetical protein [Brevibacillus invocatus]
MSRRILPLLALLAVLVTGLFTSDVPTNANSKMPIQKDTLDIMGGSILKKREFRFEDGDTYWMNQVSADYNDQPYVITIPLREEFATFRYREFSQGEDKKPYWNIVNLRDVTTLPVAPGFIETSGKYIWIGEPIVYKELGNGTVETFPGMELPIEVVQTSRGINLEIRLPQRAGYVSEIWAMESREPLVRWGEYSLDQVWLSLDLTQNAKWLYNGYHYKSPTTYEPTAENGYWRIPENYILRSFLFTGGSKAASNMGYVMLKTSLEQQEEDGHWKTLPLSQWLRDDYGIPDGFYDTRFNTGAANLMLKGCTLYEDQDFCESALQYADYFQRHAKANHYVIEGPRTGWLVEDYASTTPHLRTHVSLNHQLAEVNYLYSLYQKFGRPQDKELADTMLAGATNLGEKWILENGDLHYAYFPDGTFARADYPYLTYNDLLETQRLYKALYGWEEPTLARLIESKWGWIQRNNIPYVKVQ